MSLIVIGDKLLTTGNAGAAVALFAKLGLRLMQGVELIRVTAG